MRTRLGPGTVVGPFEGHRRFSFGPNRRLSVIVDLDRTQGGGALTRSVFWQDELELIREEEQR